MKYRVAQLSSTGARARNEDRVGIAERAQAVLLAVADGLGGHSGGALAAQTAIETVTGAFRRVHQARLADPFAFLALTLLAAHRAVVARGRAHVPPLEARTTCVLCLVQDGYAYWAHVGDSRLYHFRGERLLARTEDHSAIEELRRDGVISEDEMASHPRKSYLLRSLGGPTQPQIALSEEIALRAGDTLLLCSDGLWEALPAREMRRFIAHPDLDEGIEEMVHAAEKRRGDACDNVTVACLRWEEPTAPRPRLRAPLAPTVDAETLWREAAGRLAARRTAPAGDAGAREPRDLAQRIRELEDYLEKIEGGKDRGSD